MAAFSWCNDLDTANTIDCRNAGPLALIQPLLERLNLQAVLDRLLPHDPQQEFSHGHVLTALVAARLCQANALVNIERWADDAGYEFLGGIPAHKLNDDRLGRSLDVFFDQRHSAMAAVTVEALQTTGLSLQRLHFDPTTCCLSGAYESSLPRPDWPTDPLLRGDSHLEPAHLCYNYSSDQIAFQIGQTALIDELGAVPVFAHVLDGNRNGHPAIQQTVDLLCQHLDLPPRMRLISDRGTFSIEHLARLHRHDFEVLCAADWSDYRGLYDLHAHRLQWRQASFLSVEQKRRRQHDSSLPKDHYELAELAHQVVDPTTQQEIPVRLIFVHSTAAERECRQRRLEQIAELQAGLTVLQAKLSRGHPQCTTQTISKQVVHLLGKKEAARYFRWELVALTAQEQADLPQPAAGHRRATHRLEFHYDEAAAQAAMPYDGRSVLVTTAALASSADQLFTEYKEQNYLETLHHQCKTPLAVNPIFLKSPRRVEALVCLLQLAAQAYQVLERLYRQQMTPTDAPLERQMTAERLLRSFASYGLLVRPTHLGQVIEATRLSSRQRSILACLGFATPRQLLARNLPPEPTG